MSIFRSFSSYTLAISIGLFFYIYLNCGMFNYVPMPTIESYRKRLTAATVFEPRNNNNKKEKSISLSSDDGYSSK